MMSIGVVGAREYKNTPPVTTTAAGRIAIMKEYKCLIERMYEMNKTSLSDFMRNLYLTIGG
jgi:hypothetical protein